MKTAVVKSSVTWMPSGVLAKTFPTTVSPRAGRNTISLKRSVIWDEPSAAMHTTGSPMCRMSNTPTTRPTSLRILCV